MERKKGKGFKKKIIFDPGGGEFPVEGDLTVSWGPPFL